MCFFQTCFCCRVQEPQKSAKFPSPTVQSFNSEVQKKYLQSSSRNSADSYSYTSSFISLRQHFMWKKIWIAAASISQLCQRAIVFSLVKNYYVSFLLLPVPRLMVKRQLHMLVCSSPQQKKILSRQFLSRGVMLRAGMNCIRTRSLCLPTGNLYTSVPASQCGRPRCTRMRHSQRSFWATAPNAVVIKGLGKALPLQKKMLRTSGILYFCPYKTENQNLSQRRDHRIRIF